MALPATPPLQPFVQIAEVCLQILPEGLPRDAVHPRGSAPAQRLKRRPQAIDSHVMQERREPRLPVLLCYSAHTAQRTWRAPIPALRPERVLLVRVPLGQPPSLHHLRGRARGLVRRLRGYYGAV
jgi:hypothetical protein